MNLFIKLFINGIIGVFGLLWSQTTLLFALFAALFLSLFSYLLGDLVILPRTNNTFASTADFLLSFSLLWIACVTFLQDFNLSGVFLTAFALSIAEYLYHSYLLGQSLDNPRQPG